MPETRRPLPRQFDTAWALTDYHLQGLRTEACEIGYARFLHAVRAR